MKNRLLALTLALAVPAMAQVPVKGSTVTATQGYYDSHGQLLPPTLTGPHGTGPAVQLSDGTGTPGHLAGFDSNGNVTDIGGSTPSIQTVYWSNGAVVSGSRAVGTIYTNTGTQALHVTVTLYNIGAGNCSMNLLSAPHGSSVILTAEQQYTYTITGGPFGRDIMVPPGYDYEATTNCANRIEDWVETTVGSINSGGSGGGGGSVLSFNSRTGNVTLDIADVTTLGTLTNNTTGQAATVGTVAGLVNGDGTTITRTGAGTAGSPYIFTATGGGSGDGITGGAAGYVPLFGSAITITAQAHLDDGVTTSGTITSTEPIVATAVIGRNPGTTSSLQAASAFCPNLTIGNCYQFFGTDLSSGHSAFNIWQIGVGSEPNHYSSQSFAGASPGQLGFSYMDVTSPMAINSGANAGAGNIGPGCAGGIALCVNSGSTFTVDTSGRVTAASFNGVALSTSGSTSQYLDGSGHYSTPTGGGGGGGSPTGPAGGDLAGTYPNPLIGLINASGPKVYANTNGTGSLGVGTSIPWMWSGVDVTGNGTNAQIYSGSTIARFIVDGTDAEFHFVSNSSPSGQKNWRMVNSAGNYTLDLNADDYSASVTAYTCTGSATTSVICTFPSGITAPSFNGVATQATQATQASSLVGASAYNLYPQCNTSVGVTLDFGFPTYGSQCNGNTFATNIYENGLYGGDYAVIEQMAFLGDYNGTINQYKDGRTGTPTGSDEGTCLFIECRAYWNQNGGNTYLMYGGNLTSATAATSAGANGPQNIVMSQTGGSATTASTMLFDLTSQSSATVDMSAYIRTNGAPVLVSTSVSIDGFLTSSMVPTGTVTFYDGATSIGTSSIVNGGQIGITYTPTTTGIHVLTASYPGDSNNPAMIVGPILLPVLSSLSGVPASNVATSYTLHTTMTHAVSDLATLVTDLCVPNGVSSGNQCTTFTPSATLFPTLQTFTVATSVAWAAGDQIQFFDSINANLMENTKVVSAGALASGQQTVTAYLVYPHLPNTTLFHNGMVANGYAWNADIHNAQIYGFHVYGSPSANTLIVGDRYLGGVNYSPQEVGAITLYPAATIINNIQSSTGAQDSNHALAVLPTGYFNNGDSLVNPGFASDTTFMAKSAAYLDNPYNKAQGISYELSGYGWNWNTALYSYRFGFGIGEGTPVDFAIISGLGGGVSGQSSVASGFSFSSQLTGARYVPGVSSNSFFTLYGWDHTSGRKTTQSIFYATEGSGSDFYFDDADYSLNYNKAFKADSGAFTNALSQGGVAACLQNGTNCPSSTYNPTAVAITGGTISVSSLTTGSIISGNSNINGNLQQVGPSFQFQQYDNTRSGSILTILQDGSGNTSMVMSNANGNPIGSLNIVENTGSAVFASFDALTKHVTFGGSTDCGTTFAVYGSTCVFTVDSSGNVAALSYHEMLTTPASSTATCLAGDFTDDANYHYVCTASNTWKRALLTTF